VRLAADRGYGNVASAAALVRAGGPPCPDGHLQALERAGIDLLAGVPGPARPVAVDPSGLRLLLAGLRMLYDLVIVDVGWSLPPPTIARPSTAPRRIICP